MFLRVLTTSCCTLFMTSVAHANDDAWALLEGIEVTETISGDQWSTQKAYPADLLTDSPFRITGYYVPMLAQAYQSQIILVPDPDNCPFCGTDSYGPSLEVQLSKPLPDLPEFTQLTVTGRLETITDPDTWQAIRLIDAEWSLGGS